MDLRQYQYDACGAIEEGWSEFRRQLLVLPTGTGKTVAFAELAVRAAKRNERTLILAHRDELIQQAVEKVYKHTGIYPDIEKGAHHATQHASITVGSVQTLHEQRLKMWNPNSMDYIVVDEAHHCLADTYSRIFTHFRWSRLLGVTATPDRADKRNLGTVFENVAYEYSLTQAIHDGFLSPIRAKLLPLEIDLQGVKTVAGDFDANAVDERLSDHLEAAAKAVSENIGTRKTLVFLPLIKTSERFTELLQKYGVNARHVDGQSDNRRSTLDDFAAGRFQVLTNASLLTEGYDCPDISCIVVLRPTASRPLYCQMIGRGTRICEGKEDLLLLDFLWQSTKHSLCVPASLVAKSEEEAREMQAKMLGKPGAEEDLLEAQRDVVAEREEKLRKQLEKNMTKKARTIDPLAFALSICDSDLAEWEPTMPWHYQEASPKQLEFLGRSGINLDLITCKGHASALIDRMMSRFSNGLCTPKQAATLMRFGYADAATYTRDFASTLIDELAKNGWKRKYIAA